MTRSVAFLRGINVGGHRVTKDELIAVFSDLGFADVDTFLASGNVLFGNGPEMTERAMAEALERRLGYAVPTTVRGPAEVELLAEAEPFPTETLAAATGKPQAILLFDEITPAVERAVLDRSNDEDLLVPAQRAVYWLPFEGISGSGLDMSDLLGLVGQNTVRTINTIRRLVPKL